MGAADGRALAIGVVPAIENRWLAEALGALGLVLIALAIFALTEGTHYLGVAII
jgi:hypothetical protein